jgi:hypothetical protein
MSNNDRGCHIGLIYDVEWCRASIILFWHGKCQLILTGFVNLIKHAEDAEDTINSEVMFNMSGSEEKASHGMSN